MKADKTVILVSQVFVPDSPSVGQHMFDLARELVKRGLRVVVFAPRRGYEDPSVRFAKREIREGVEIRRLPWCAFGKRSIPLRLLGGMSLVFQSMLRGLFLRGLTHLLITTVPPMSGLVATWIKTVRRVRVVYWVMDLNPDQIIATGKMRENSLAAKLSGYVLRCTLRNSEKVVAMDSFMAERLERKVPLGPKLSVIPPWPYEDQLADIPHSDNPFRRIHKLEDRFVVMYSGNITDVHPLTTLLEAMDRLREDSGFTFVFIGASAARRKIDAYAMERGLRNVLSLGYVPLEETRFSLSAADLHVVTMGDAMVGIVHPCKVYGIMSVGRPFLAIGPKKSHLGEILSSSPVGWQVEHGDVEGVVRVLREARQLSPQKRQKIGALGRQRVLAEFSRITLCSRFGDLIVPPKEDGPGGDHG